MHEVIIQNCATLQFLGEGRWLKNRAGAKHFSTGSDAIEYCLDHRIDGNQMVLRFDGSFQVVEIPGPGDDFEIRCF